MSFQNNKAKASLSLQNHIVWPCFIFITQNAPIMHNPVLAKQLVHTFHCASAFSTLTQYMSVSHGYSTIGGIEYDDGCSMKKTKKEKVSY